MIQVSRYSSLDFGSRWKLDFQIQENYVQRFKSTDVPRVQYVDDIGADTLVYININDSITEITPNILIENETLSIREFTLDLTGLSGCIQVYFEQNGEIVLSSMFEVSDNVDDTILLEYTHRRNDFDTYFDLEHKFCFRVEGVFLPQEYSFDNETEGFRDQRHKAKELSSYTIEKRKLTIGGGFGVPNWVARLLNNIFSLSNVHVDGVRTIRSDGAAIEITTIHNDYPLYIYKLDLETTEDEEAADIISLLRVVDSKKKVARSTGESIRTYNILAQELGMTDSKMIRELLNIAKITDSTEIEVDVPTEPESNKITLKQLREYILSELSETLEELKDLLDWFGMDNSGNIYVKDGKNFYTEGGISSGGPGSGGAGGSGGSLGSLVNVDESADKVPTEDKAFVRKANSTHWTVVNLSDIVGLDTEALSKYLTTNKYATQAWVQGLGYLTKESISKDFVLTTTFNSHVNNERDEKHVTADFLDSVGLLLDSIGVDDSGNVYIKSGKNLYTIDGGISAGKPGEDGGGASSGALSGLVDVALTSPVDGDLLMYSGTHWVNIKQSELVPDLAGYATEDYVDERVDALINGAPAAYDTLKEIADVLAGNVNSIGDLMTAIGDKANKATTLAGYGITDAKIANGVITLGENSITPLTSHQTIYNLTLQSGVFTAGVFDPNGAAKTINVPTTTDHISEGSKLFFTNARAVLALGDTLSKYVTLAGAQSITGEKTFTADTTKVKSLTINGFLIDVVDGALRFNGNVFSTGGVSAGGQGVGGGSGTSYNRLDDWASYNAANGDVLSALLGYDLKTRIDNIDNTLANGVLSSFTVKVGSNAYSSVDGVVSLPAYPTALKNPYSLTVNGVGYDGSAAKSVSITAASLGALTAHQAIYNLTLQSGAFTAGTYTPNSAAKTINVPTKTSHLTNDSGFITSGAIPTSLKNPNALSWSGYSSGSYDGSAEKSITIPTTLPASDVYAWAKASTKPSYTFSEIGSKPTTLSGYGITDAAPGGYVFLKGTNLDDVFDLNKMIVVGVLYDGSVDNKPDGFIYGGVMNISPYYFLKPGPRKDLNMQLAWSTMHNSTSNTTGHLWYRVADGVTYFENSKWKKILTESDNAASATKLATPRTIWGQSFDGTGNVDGNPVFNCTSAYIFHTGSNYSEGIRLANKNGTSNTWSEINFGCDFNAFNGTHETQWTVGRSGNNNHFVIRNNTTDRFTINLNGNVGIGTASSSYKLHVIGDIYATGAIIGAGGVSAATASDYRLKENIRPLDWALKLINKINVKSFTYNSIARGYDKHLPDTDAGYIAQEFETLLPQYVMKMYESDYLGIRYEKMIPYLTAGIQEVDKKTERIKQATRSILAILERHGASEEEKNEIRNNINLLNN